MRFEGRTNYKMNEQTVEEKLRQTLEGNTSDSNNNGRTPHRSARRAKKTSEAAKKPDPFMEDFEKKIEQSLDIKSTFKAPSKNQTEKIINNDELGIMREAPLISVPSPITEQEPEELGVRSDEAEVIEEPEQEEAPLTPAPSPIAEQELPEIPLIEDENQEDAQYFEENNNFNDESEGSLPDIPVISADEDNSSEEDYEEVEEVNESENKSLPENFSPSADIVLNVDEEIPQAQEPNPNFEGEAMPVSVAMPETTKTAEDKLMADIAEAMTGNPLTLETRETPEPYKLPENFLNEVNNNDPSRQSAEEKLIANIAQAISESPLDAAHNNASQDLEEEINNLDFVPSFPDHEERLTEEFDFSQYEENEPEEPEPVVEQPQEDEPEKPETEIEATFDEVPLPEPVQEPDPEPAEEPEEVGVRSEPVYRTGRELGGIDEPAQEIIDEPEIIDTPTENSESVAIEETEEQQKEPEESEEAEVSNEESGTVDEPAENSEPAQEISDEPGIIDTPTEEELKQEENLLPEDTEEVQENEMPEQTFFEENESIEDVSSELSPESNFEDTDDNTDDFDINSLGALSAAASIMPDYDYDEPVEKNYEDSSFDSGLETNMPTLNDVIINTEEEKDKEKIMEIREKIAGRKNKMAKDASGDKKKKFASLFSGGIFMPLLLIMLLAVGGFIAWQLMQLNDRLTSGLMNMGMSVGTFDAVPEKNPSYDYAIDFIFDSNLSTRMAQRGKEGWQVVGSRRTQDSITGQLGYEFIFMRKTPGK